MRSKRGFAAMSPEKHLELCRKGGSAVKPENRVFAKNHELASKAGKIGGESVPAMKRSFSRDRELAREAGRRGGLTTQRLCREQRK